MVVCNVQGAFVGYSPYVRRIMSASNSISPVNYKSAKDVQNARQLYFIKICSGRMFLA